MAERVHLVIFIDDLQWADKESLALLEHLVAPAGALRYLLIATRRALVDGESSTAAGQDKEGDPLGSFRRLRLRGLPRGESRALLRQLWGETPQEMLGDRRLDKLLAEAAGHPLFLSELVRYTKTREDSAPAQTTLQEVLWQRITRLSEPERRFMEVVALAGAPIKAPVAAKAAGVDASESLNLMSSLRVEQMIRVSRRADARLVEPYHDRMREAIVEHLRSDMVASGRRAELHLRIGRHLLESTSADELFSEVFTIVHHLSRASELLVDPAERRRVAELHLTAAQQARRATAYERALLYAERGLTFLDGDPWNEEYTLCSALHFARMEAAYRTGQRAQAIAWFEALLPRLREPEIAELYVAKIVLDTGVGQFGDAIATSRRGLEHFGFSLPKKATRPAVLLEYAATRLAQGSRRIAELADLPTLDDVPKQCAMQILIAVAPTAFFVDRPLMSVCMMRIARLSMKFGLTDVSSYGFAGYGMVLSGAFMKHEEAYQFGQLALRLNERFQNHRLVSKLFHLNGTFLTSWVRPFAEAKAQLRAGGEAALKYGDVVYEAYSAATLSLVTFCHAADLAEMQTCSESARATTMRRRDDDMTGMAAAHARFAGALRAGATWDLASPESDDATFRSTLSDAKTPTAIFHYFFCNGLLAWFGGQKARAAEMFAEAALRPGRTISSPSSVELCLMEALTAAEQAQSVSGLKRLQLLWKIRQRLSKLALWARNCPSNFEAQYRIARAEAARALGNVNAGKRYEDAVAAARRHGATMREALALELYGAWLRARGRDVEARARLSEARDAYARWGANAKVTQLERVLAAS
jgi:predicted ATPase